VAGGVANLSVFMKVLDMVVYLHCDNVLPVIEIYVILETSCSIT